MKNALARLKTTGRRVLALALEALLAAIARDRRLEADSRHRIVEQLEYLAAAAAESRHHHRRIDAALVALDCGVMSARGLRGPWRRAAGLLKAEFAGCQGC